MSTVKKIKVLFLLFGIFGMTSMFAQTENMKVTDAELEKFATAFQSVQMESQKAQQQMMGVIQEEGMDVARFSEIQKAEANPNQEVEATEAEMKSYKTIMADIEKMQPMIEQKMEAHVTDAGLKVERYQAIASRLQSDQDLQNRLRSLVTQ